MFTVLNENKEPEISFRNYSDAVKCAQELANDTSAATYIAENSGSVYKSAYAETIESFGPSDRGCSKDHTQLTTRDVFFRFGLTWGCLECGADIRQTALLTERPVGA